jgi:hypothetical protein
MTYMVMINDRRGDAKWIEEALLDGIVPVETISHMTVESSDDLGLCKICISGGACCHIMVPIAPHTYTKYCPVLWHDVFHPTKWKVEDLV